MNHNKIIAKLIKIAHNQQKIIEKLAQAADPNIDYLRSAAEAAAINASFKASHYQVMAGSNGYVVSVQGAPKNNNLRQNYINVLKRQVATQKPDQPDLAKNLSVTFND